MADKQAAFSDAHWEALQAVNTVLAMASVPLCFLPSPDDEAKEQQALAQFQDSVAKLAEHTARFLAAYQATRHLLIAAIPSPPVVALCGKHEPYAHDIVGPLCSRILASVKGLDVSFDTLELWREAIGGPTPAYYVPDYNKLERLRAYLEAENIRVIGTKTLDVKPTPEYDVKPPDRPREELFAELEPADRKAYFSHSWAEGEMIEAGAARVTDQEAYDWLKENGLPDEKDSAELANEFAAYQLPPFDTWSRQVRNARAVLGAQKYTRRAGRPTGGSIVSVREIEHQQGDDE